VFKHRSQKIVSPTYNIPAYEYAKEASVRFDFPEYVSQPHGFKVRFPVEPTITKVGVVTNYATILEGEAAYNIFVNYFEKTFVNDEDIKSCLKDILRGRLSLLGDKANIELSREVLFLGYQGLEYKYTANLEENIVYFRGIYFAKQNLVYGIAVVCSEETKALAYSKYDDLIRSFILIEQTKEK
jgi:hypothetical protein